MALGATPRNGKQLLLILSFILFIQRYTWNRTLVPKLRHWLHGKYLPQMEYFG